MFCDCNGEDTEVGVPRIMGCWESSCEAIENARPMVVNLRCEVSDGGWGLSARRSLPGGTCVRS